MQTSVNKVVVVTGAASGIGLEIASLYKSHGYTAVCLDLKAPPSEAKIEYIHCDVSSEASVVQAFSTIQKDYGPVNVLINNCGLQFMSPVEDFPLEKWNLLISVLLTGTFLCSKAAIAQLKQTKNARIINISSIHGKLASPYKSAYVTAKHGVLGLAKVMAIELAEHNITVNTICPGFVDTPLMRAQVQSQMQLNNISETEVLNKIFLKDQHIKSLTQSKQVAELCWFLTGESASTITGEAFNMSGGWGMGL